jgi:hypothetical protein
MTSLHLDQLYQPGTSEKVLEVERDLGRELTELTAELEESEMQKGTSLKMTRYEILVCASPCVYICVCV